MASATDAPRTGEKIIETCRLSTSHVKLGVPLPGSVYDEHGMMLLSKGQILESQTQLDALLARGMYVELSVFETHYRNASAAAAPSPAERKFDPFLVRDTLKISLNRLLRAVIDGSAQVEQIVEFADHARDFAETDAEAAIASSLLDRHEEMHAVGHCLSTAILGALLVKRLDWLEERRRSIVCAALTMNLGMFDLQQRLQRQASPLTPPQQAQIDGHPDVACEALKKIGVTDAIWLDAVAQHHEMPGGKGYPHHVGTPAEEAQLLRLMDTFFARASIRADRHPLPPAQIIRALFVEDGQGPYGTLVASLVKFLGLYPPGSFIKLANGETGVVFRAGENTNTPIVASVTTASGIPLMQPVRRDTSREAFAVSAPVAPDKVSVGYDLGKLWVTNVKT